ncbi:MAG: hypothetical protein ABIO02_01540 [Patescibacteria group bacterium]
MKKILSLLFVAVSLVLLATIVRNVEAVNTNVASPVTKKIMVIDYDPTILTPDNTTVRLSQWDREHYGYNTLTPRQMTDRFIELIKQKSGNYLNYQVTDFQELDEFPVQCDQTNGFTCRPNSDFQFTRESFRNCLMATTNQERVTYCHDPNVAKYNQIMERFDVCGKRNRGEIDEVWLYGRFWLGFWEANMTGPNAFNTNGPILLNTSCNKQMHIMGFSYQRPVTEMLHNYGHRTEGVMLHTFGSWTYTYPQGNQIPTPQPAPRHDWDRFSIRGPDHPQIASCGFVHGNLNSPTFDDYDYSNSITVPSSCNSWYSYPNLSEPAQNINCSAWGCSESGFMKFWLDHIPRFNGTTAGKWNNWWQYITDYQVATEPIRPPTGFHDGNNDTTCTINGWTCDLDRASSTIQVIFQDQGTGREIGRTTASNTRPDLGPSCAGTTNHGFSFTVPQGSFIRDGQNHNVNAIAVDVNSLGNENGEIHLLGATPKQIHCTSGTPPVSTPTPFSTPTTQPTPTIHLPSPTFIPPTPTAAVANQFRITGRVYTSLTNTVCGNNQTWQGRNGVSVKLINGYNNQLLQRVVTYNYQSADGAYIFNNLGNGEYLVEIDPVSSLRYLCSYPVGSPQSFRVTINGASVTSTRFYYKTQ